jgi:hypothetical protein
VNGVEHEPSATIGIQDGDVVCIEDECLVPRFIADLDRGYPGTAEAGRRSLVDEGAIEPDLNGARSCPRRDGTDLGVAPLA